MSKGIHSLKSLLICCFLLFPQMTKAETPQLHVGFIAALSGPAQAYGEASRNGFELALQELGNRSIRVSYEDDQFNPTKTVAAFRKLTELDHVEMVVCVGSSTCNAVAPLAETRGIPLVGWASDTNVSRNRKSVIRSFPSGEAEGFATGEEAIRRKFSKIAIFSSIHDYTLSWRRGLIAALPPELVVMDEQVQPSSQDFKTLLLKARERGAENFVICLVSGLDGLFAKQARELKITGRIGGCMFLEDKNEAKLANGALEGAWYITVPIDAAFSSRYEKKFGNTNAMSGAAIHYDLAHLLSMVVSSDGTSHIIKSLMSIKSLEGKAGTLTTKTSDDDQYFDYQFVFRDIGK